MSTSNYEATYKYYEERLIKHETAEIVMINFELRNHVKLVHVLISELQQFAMKSLLCCQYKSTILHYISLMVSDQQLGRTHAANCIHPAKAKRRVSQQSSNLGACSC